MKKVLVIDNDESHRSLVTESLEAEGFDTFEIDDSSVVVTLAKNYQPDLIISSVIMDASDASLLRDSLREDPQTSSIPMILLTEKDLVGGAAESDPKIGYLKKPFDVLELVSVVARKLNPNLQA